MQSMGDVVHGCVLTLCWDRLGQFRWYPMGRRIAAMDLALYDPCMTMSVSGHVSQGHNIQGTLCLRGATSKNFWFGTHWSGTHQPCILLGSRHILILRNKLAFREHSHYTDFSRRAVIKSTLLSIQL
jgi:hypothetical protein